jgi:hypothetical protein
MDKIKLTQREALHFIATITTEEDRSKMKKKGLGEVKGPRMPPRGGE